MKVCVESTCVNCVHVFSSVKRSIDTPDGAVRGGPALRWNGSICHSLRRNHDRMRIEMSTGGISNDCMC